MATPPSRKVIDQLRNRSWEMELLLSGFVLVLLLPVPGIILEQGSIVAANLNISIYQQLFSIAFAIGLFGSRVLIVNLIIYLFLRGFWIGIVGLTSAFPAGIQWKRVGYQQPYQKYLERKTPDTESYINILNKISSTAFSFSFFLVFLIIAFFASLLPVILVVVSANAWLADLPASHWSFQVLNVVLTVIFILYFSLAIIFLIDFLTFGLIKRIGWKPIKKLYFPIYRFFRKLTLASLYTPIYYTLISNVPRRIIAVVLISYLAIFLFFNNFGYSEEIFYPTQKNSYQMLARYYEDQYDEPAPTLVPLIPSEYVEHSHLRLFLPYLVSDNDSLRQVCPEVKVFSEPGFVTDMQISFTYNTATDTTQEVSEAYQEENLTSALDCLTGLYEIYVDDSLYRPSVFYFNRRNANNQPGLLTYLSVESIPSGPHQLTIKKRNYGNNIADAYDTYRIPFVKE